MLKDFYDIIVVGAGPAGSMAAWYAAEQGVSVLLLEKDREIGTPVRCAEAVSKAGIEEFIESDPKFIAATIRNFMFVAPDGTKVNMPLPEEGYVLDRKLFDYELARRASLAGAEILTRAYVNGLLFENDVVAGVKFEYAGETKEINSGIVIAADGVESRVGRWAGIKTFIDFRDMECCTQITAGNLLDISSDTCYFYFGQEYAPQGYFWVFPKGEHIANIGLGVGGMVGKKRSAKSYLESFMDNNYPDAAVLTRIAGGVPSTLTLEKIQAPGIILVGDAARQVNPLSGGGIASGMIGGSIGGRIAGEAIKRKNPQHLLTYQKAWMDRLGNRHKIFDRLKEGIYNFSDDKFNAIAHAVEKIPENNRSLNRIFTAALLNKPSLLIDVAKVFL